MKKLLLIFLVFCFIKVYAQLPEYYSSEVIQSGYSGIMGTIFSSDGTKMFSWIQSGQIFLSNWDGSSYIKQNTAVLDISDEVSGYRDFGLLSICLDPDFDTNGLIYLFYTVDRHHLLYAGTPTYDADIDTYFQASISRVTRYQINHNDSPMTTNYASRLILLGESITTGVPLTHQSHAGGTILFGTDGTLILTTGDNASYTSTDTGSRNETYYQQALDDGIMRDEENVGAFRSQMINSLCGKVLRIDSETGDGLPSNPHYDSDNPRSAASRMWAMGLRNPFRMAIKYGSGSTNPADANPGTLFVADVGWQTWEDLHIIDKPGLNAGWPLYEGQTALSSYYNSGTNNLDEEDTPFTSLCVQPTSFTDDENPANRRYVHRRPSLTWKHGSDRVRVPWFNGNTPTNPRVGSIGSPTTGIEFRGNAGISGIYVLGTTFGEELQGKYLFTDYGGNWVQIATLNNSNSPWVNHISEFASSGFGDGIVHMMQNPLDGSVFYSNIFNGEIRRFSFFDDTLTNDSVDFNIIKIIPNPIKNYITILGNTDEYKIEFYSVSGQLIFSDIVQNSRKTPVLLSPGFYLMKVMDALGNQSIKKVIVE